MAMPSQTSEQGSLHLGIWVSLTIAVLGLVAYAFSGSDAVLLDGLYAGVMAGTSLVAARVGANVKRPPDRGWPFGYEGQEALYVLLRSLLLIGILSFALLAALQEILAYLQGQIPEAVELGPVGWYGLLGGLSCGALAWVQHRAWIAGGRCSELLRTESRAALLDTAITGITGAALMAAPWLTATPLAPLVPISDALLVVVLALVVIAEPIQRFAGALRETAGAACDPALIRSTRQQVQELLRGASAALLDLSVVKLGRISFVVAYLDPGQPVDGAWLDNLRDQLDHCCGELLGPVRTELVITHRAPFCGTPGAA
jgi:predicted Co/Zn/Cd cation transporter (cation efflux family)